MLPKELIKKLKNGTKEDIFEVQKIIEKKISQKNSSKNLIFEEILKNISDFSKIEEKNKIAFIKELKIFLQLSKKEHYPFFGEFIIKNIEDDSKKVRMAVLDLAEPFIFYAFFIKGKKYDLNQDSFFIDFIDQILFLLDSYQQIVLHGSDDLKFLEKYKSIKALFLKVLEPIKQKKLITKFDYLEKESLFLDGFDDFEYFDNFIANKKAPKPDQFPFYLEIKNWTHEFKEIAELSLEKSEFWIFTEEASDLFWYLEILLERVYLQLCNRYLIENGEDFLSNYKYQKYFLIEIIKAIKISMAEILKIKTNQKEDLRKILQKLVSLEEKIFNI